ncbi:HU family DNA-binding protein [Lacimonas salitolerans]|uniref:HU family DNA-binding protein n=1 Tax=Lacimonas salitolerans TaxID=1323750 RepID=A0ABW4ED18_9RHOB
MATTTRKTPAKTTTRKTTSKSAAASGTAAKSAAIASVEQAAPEPTVVTSTVPDAASPEMKKKELIDAVVARSGIKKKDAKPVVEAMLAVLGEEMGQGRELNLQPLGKMKINRIKQLSGAKVVMCKLRQNETLGKPDADPLADAAE